MRIRTSRKQTKGKKTAGFRYGRIEQMDRSFDIEFWQAQDASARLRAGWDLVELYLRSRGRTNELGLQRTVAAFRQQQS
jgi:hypothetical protein